MLGIFYEKLGDKKKYTSNHEVKTQEQPVVRAIPMFCYHNKNKQFKTKNEKMRNASTFLIPNFS